MSNKTFLDSTLPSIQGYLEELWECCEQPRAIYARGSILLPMDSLVHIPWDMDFVMFVSANEDVARRAAIAIMSKISVHEAHLPPPDISVFNDNYYFPETMYALMMISKNGKFLWGDDCRVLDSIFTENHTAISQYALSVCIKRLNSFISCVDSAEQQKRAPHLAKSVLRLGGLLRLQDGFFTRKPTECAILLTKENSLIGSHADVLMESLNASVEPETLITACNQVLSWMNRIVSGLHYGN